MSKRAIIIRNTKLAGLLAERFNDKNYDGGHRINLSSSYEIGLFHSYVSCVANKVGMTKQELLDQMELIGDATWIDKS